MRNGRLSVSRQVSCSLTAIEQAQRLPLPARTEARELQGNMTSGLWLIEHGYALMGRRGQWLVRHKSVGVLAVNSHMAALIISIFHLTEAHKTLTDLGPALLRSANQSSRIKGGYRKERLARLIAGRALNHSLAGAIGPAGGAMLRRAARFGGRQHLKDILRYLAKIGK